MSKKNNNALILFTKAPRLGQVKTRLQPELTPEQSLLLYQAMVEDTVRQFNDVAFCDLKIFFHPADANGEMKIWLGNQFDYFPQQGHDLGERMHHAIAEMLNQKYDKVTLVGSDIPNLDATTMLRAFASMDNHDVVLGPSNDGGYYLIGMKLPHPELFKEIVWSTNLVLQQTIHRARAIELKIIQLEKKSDIDSYHEVQSLWKYLQQQNRARIYSNHSNTYEALRKIFEIEDASNANERGEDERI
ncbi:MAG TPA: TIGR04282 family arsenosugar biosynthesis glycosyltransferase [bacterium]